jgi:hypothetical protein
MKNLIILILFGLNLTLGFSQNMKWVPAENAINGCNSLTNAKKNILCYNLEYTPEKTGVLSSYTAGFWVDCGKSETVVFSNKSCSMTDNSQQVAGCEKYGKTFFNSSGNSGSQANNYMTKGVPVYLHQVCLMVNPNEELLIVKDDITDLTTNIDLGSGASVTEFPSYKSFVAKNIIKVVEEPSVEVLNNTLTTSTASSPMELDEKIELFPNPAYDYINVKVVSTQEFCTLQIFDGSGVSKFNQLVKSNENIKFDVSSYAPGLYYVSVKSDNKVVNRKFIVLAH